MQRKDIKVGEAYAVTNERGPRRSYASKVKATVVRLDAEYEKKSRYGRSTFTANDGILVRFDEPVVFDWGGLRALSDLLKRDAGHTTAAKKEFKKDAITEWVASDARFIVEPWDEYEARMNMFAENEARYQREADEAATEFAPKLGDAMERLHDIGLKNVSLDTDRAEITFDGGSIKLATQKGTRGKVVTDFAKAATIETDVLLGLAEKATV
jgi:hypothetical protein